MSDATDFLREFLPSGPWLLAAFGNGRPHFARFTPEQANDASQWINDRGDRCNIYFHVNPTRDGLSTKASKTDVTCLAHLHVDLDPRAGEPLDDERQRLLSLLTENLPDGVPEPDWIIDSGGGYWGFWRLAEPLELDGTEEAAEDAKLWNLALERKFEADACHNIDRLARLPGTTNIPDQKKRDKGRLEAPAVVVSHKPEPGHAWSVFEKAEPGSAIHRGLPPAAIAEPGEANLDSVDDLDEYGVPDRLKAIIVEGNDPDNPKEGDNSRSAWLWDVACNLTRCDVPDDIVFAIITDKDFAISESVYDKGGRWREYALRTIVRAKDHATDPLLCDLNDKYMVVKNLGGRCRVVHEIDEFGRRKLVKQSFEDFRNAYLNQRVQIGSDKQGNATYMPMGKWWLEHHRRRQFERIEFKPEQQVADGVFNLWQGFAMEAKPGDCSLLLAHIKDNVCGGDDDLFRYVESWMARAVQKPGVPGETAIVLRGGQGVGKSFFAKALGRLFGQHFLHISNAGHVVGNFNAHLRDCVLLFGDEAFYAGDKRHESQLKTLVTEYTLMIEGKGIDAELSTSCLHLILASNKKWVVPADADDRRFLVLDVGDSQKQNSSYFNSIQDQLDNGGYEALLHYLQRLDLSDFDHRSIPDTAAKRDQKLRSLDVFQQIVFDMLEEGDSRSACEDASGHWVRGPDLVQHIKGRSAETNIGSILREISELKRKRMVQEYGEPKQRWCYLLKPLSMARAAFEEHIGFEIDWSECQGWDEYQEVQDEAPF